MFRGCRPEDMPPHIYAVAQTAYRGLLATRRDQSVVLMGRSGSGKTTNARHLMQYYLVSAGCVSAALTGKISMFSYIIVISISTGKCGCGNAFGHICLSVCVYETPSI